MTRQRSARHFNKRTVGVRLDPETIAQIEALAKRQRVTLSEAVRLLVEWGFESLETST